MHPKSKAALVVGFVGSAFHGSQVQLAGVRTVESELFAALHAARLVSDANFAGGVGKVQFSRSSRTDRGVHALALVCGCKLALDREAAVRDVHGLAVAQQLNVLLPPDLRVFACVRVPGSFNARRNITARTYHYWVPRRVIGDAAAVARLDAVCAKYVGTHSWHNFTTGGGGGDHVDDADAGEPARARPRSAASLMRHVSACRLVAHDDTFVRIEVIGTSFLYNQIRKMVGMALSVARGHADVAAVDAALRADVRMELPRAPPHGLVLVGSRIMAPSEHSCTPYRDLATVFEAPAVSDAMARFLRDHVARQIPATWDADE